MTYTISYTEQSVTGNPDMRFETVTAGSAQEAREVFAQGRAVAVLNRGAIVKPGALVWFVSRDQS